MQLIMIWVEISFWSAKYRPQWVAYAHIENYAHFLPDTWQLFSSCQSYVYFCRILLSRHKICQLFIHKQVSCCCFDASIIILKYWWCCSWQHLPFQISHIRINNGMLPQQPRSSDGSRMCILLIKSNTNLLGTLKGTECIKNRGCCILK